MAEVTTLLGQFRDVLNSLLVPPNSVPHPLTMLTSVLVSSGTNAAFVLVTLCAFGLARRAWPFMYMHNAELGKVPEPLPSTLFGWIGCSLRTKLWWVSEHRTLDERMYLESIDLGMRILLLLSAQICLVPLRCCLLAFSARTQALETQHFFQVLLMPPGASDRASTPGSVSPSSLLWYAYAAAVWLVCLTVTRSLNRAQERFLPLRRAWLQRLPKPRSSTVLIENIPWTFRCDDRLHSFFADIFGQEDAVKEVHMIRDTKLLLELIERRRRAQRNVQELEEAEGEKTGEPLTLESAELRGNLEELVLRINAERSRLERASCEPGRPNTCSAFVTFSECRFAEIARDLVYSSDGTAWKVCRPPEPATIRWADFIDVRWSLLVRASAGVFVVLVFCVLLVATVSVMGLVRGRRFSNIPALQLILDSAAPSIPMCIVYSLVPEVLLRFAFLFRLRAKGWEQYTFQRSFFVFQVGFVLLVTSLSGVIDLVLELRSDAMLNMKLLALLAESLPPASHYYMHFIVMQWFVVAVRLLRMSNMMHYVFGRLRCRGPAEARDAAEPESQTWDGMGARSAIVSINLLVGIIFSSVCPVLVPLVLIYFALLRLVHGYLIVFQEREKNDLGGSFWVCQLRQLHYGTIIYCVLMIGLLSVKASGTFAAYVALPSLPYILWSLAHFGQRYRWEKLSIEDYRGSSAVGSLDTGESYIQPELLSDDFESFATASFMCAVSGGDDDSGGTSLEVDMASVIEMSSTDKGLSR